MPVEALVSLVAEEALGVAVGAAAVAAAPVVVVGAAVVAVQVAVPTLSRSVSGGAQWYGERWTGLLDEAQVTRTSRRSNSVTLAGLLASMASAPVLSNTPGRARLRLMHLKGRPDRSVFIAEAVATMPGVFQVSANPHTGTVLIHYDTLRYVTLDSLLDWIVAS